MFSKIHMIKFDDQGNEYAAGIAKLRKKREFTHATLRDFVRKEPSFNLTRGESMAVWVESADKFERIGVLMSWHHVSQVWE